MKFRGLSFIADENISDELIDHLKSLSFLTKSIWEAGLAGSNDNDIIEYATKNQLVILTQDRDFGTLIHTTNIPFVGIVYLRPGHLSATFHIRTFEAILREVIVIEPPFILVAENNGAKIKLRIRNHINLV